MKYEVIVMPAAIAEMDESYAWLELQTPQHVPEWYNGLLEALYSLEELPGRCPIAAESKDVGAEVRQLMYGDRRHAYRILFEIAGDKVRILHIRHGARKG